MSELPTPPLTAADVQRFDDSVPSDVANDMIETVWARALSVADCLGDATFGENKPSLIIELKALIRGVVLRWADAGSGGVRSRGALDYNEQLEVASGGGKLRPNEIRDLQQMCTDSKSSSVKAHTFPMFAWERPVPTVHPFITDTEHGPLF